MQTKYPDWLHKKKNDFLYSDIQGLRIKSLYLQTERQMPNVILKYLPLPTVRVREGDCRGLTEKNSRARTPVTHF